MAGRVPAFRVSIFLPVETGAQQIAATRVTDFLQATYGGATRSPDYPASFKGFWFDKTRQELCFDEIAIAFTDIGQAEYQDRIDDELKTIEAKAREIYDSLDAHEEEFWVTCETIEVFQS